MPRQNNKYGRPADAVFTADMHLRDDTPECRIDDFAAARDHKIAWLRALRADNGNCPIIDGGDVFNKWQASSELEGMALLNLPDDMVTVPGNHDLPNHSLKLYKKSSLHVLEAAGKVKVLKGNEQFIFKIGFNKVTVIGYPYGQPLQETAGGEYRRIAVIHAYCAEAVPAFIEGYTPQQLLAALPGYDVIVCGDHHAGFDYSVTDRRGHKRLVVNPGSMMRTTADQADYRPRVYLWYAEENECVPAYYPAKPGVVSREHLEKVEERDARMEAFISRLDTDVEIGLSFEANLKAFFAANATRQAVRDAVWEAVNGK